MERKTNRLSRPVVGCLLVLCAACGPTPSNTSPADSQGYTDPVETDARRVILCLGDSLTAGYYLDPADAFPALIQQRLDALDWPYRAVNAGVSGDTTIDGLNRLDWLLVQPVDVLVLALGANDALRGQPVSHIRKNLDAIIRRTRAAYPGAAVVLAGMVMPVNYGEPYRTDFESMYTELAQAHDARLIPFLLEGVAGVPELNLRDGIHPTEAGHHVIAATVWRHLEPILRNR